MSFRLGSQTPLCPVDIEGILFPANLYLLSASGCMLTRYSPLAAPHIRDLRVEHVMTRNWENSQDTRGLLGGGGEERETTSCKKPLNREEGP